MKILQRSSPSSRLGYLCEARDWRLECETYAISSLENFGPPEPERFEPMDAFTVVLIYKPQ